MKIEAKVEFNDKLARILGQSTMNVNVDMDYVESNADDINEWIVNELEKKYEWAFVAGEDFKVTNMDELIEELSYDEFLDKTTC